MSVDARSFAPLFGPRTEVSDGNTCKLSDIGNSGLKVNPARNRHLEESVPSSGSPQKLAVKKL